MNAKEIITKHFDNMSHSMTPNIIEYGMISQTIAYELSQGENIICEYGVYDELYGVTCIELGDNGTHLKKDLSSCFPTIHDARTHIANMKVNFLEGE